MSEIKSFKDLLVWQKATDISVEVYSLTRKLFPSDEIFGLTSQVRRASNSISLNIAEGHGKHTTKNFVHYLNTAFSSKNEVESGFLLAIRLDFLKEEDCKVLFDLLTEESKMLSALIDKLNNKDN
jgi:four helix bundle protein